MAVSLKNLFIDLFTIPKKTRNFRAGCRVWHKVRGCGIITDVDFAYSTKLHRSSWLKPELRVCRIRFDDGSENEFSITGLSQNDDFQILSLS